MLYRVVHETRYRYDAPVSQCQSEIRMTPRSLPWQTVADFTFESMPAPIWTDTRTDYFGNDVRSFLIQERHDRFSTIATSRVRVESRGAISSGASWESVRDALREHASPDALQAFEFTFDSPFVTTAGELVDYARPSFEAGRPLVDALADLTHRIKVDFTYSPSSTAIDTPLLETLRRKRGVCQDFSHIMIGALRSMGLATRYVSGYVRSGSNRLGSEASHAWVGVFVPGAGWIDYDPTNDVKPDLDHVTLAWGRDYGDVPPMKGIALGGGRQKVEVDVRVERIDS
jgi:transglutaminase-like putative cysteine protease